MAQPELPFSLDWLAGAAIPTRKALSACPAGHLLVNERSCWSPVRFSTDLRALFMRPADDCPRGGAHAARPA